MIRGMRKMNNCIGIINLDENEEKYYGANKT